ncbi:MAG: class I SAM-dependent methyltransferase [Deltaproteobacteria bacterium]|nr:class I SAM-dependent methyltransferase [Deltaproteobacteria bacterium]
MNQAGKTLTRMYTEHHSNGGRLGQSRLEKERAALFTSWVGTGKRILDLGCRDATLTRHFLEGNQVLGGDIDASALKKAREQYGLEAHHIDLNAGLPFADQDFDVVILAETLEHLPYPTITLAEIQRVLKPDGFFIGNVPLEYHLSNRFRILRGRPFSFDPTHLQHFSYKSLCALLGQYFVIEKSVALHSERIGRLQLARFSLNLFAKNVAFYCRKKS